MHHSLWLSVVASETLLKVTSSLSCWLTYEIPMKLSVWYQWKQRRVDPVICLNPMTL